MTTSVIYNLPREVYNKFNNYSDNGQSKLLQEVKGEIQLLYTKTDIKGDGQVVIISFSDGDIELVPGFQNSDNVYLYPDTNCGGTWKKTNPLPEQEESFEMSIKTNMHFEHLCRILRKWKDNSGFKFKGLLIDTLVKKFLDNLDDNELSFVNYSDIIINLFEHLSLENEECSYWLALGSNQKITNDDNGKFIKKAKKVYNKLKDIKDEETKVEILSEVLGYDIIESGQKQRRISPNEEFIHHKFVVDIRYNMMLGCIISQDGFRPYELSDFLIRNYRLKANKKLDFSVVSCDIPVYLENEIRWFWKIKNIGYEAEKRNEERGEIIEGEMNKIETTKFTGEHYVECYAVLNKKVIAKAHIDVPIDTVIGKDYI